MDCCCIRTEPAKRRTQAASGSAKGASKSMSISTPRRRWSEWFWTYSRHYDFSHRKPRNLTTLLSWPYATWVKDIRDAESSPGGRYRNESGYVISASGAPRIRSHRRGGWAGRRRDRPPGDARHHPDGHEPARAGRMGSDAHSESGGGYAIHSRNGAHGARHGWQSRQRARMRLR